MISWCSRLVEFPARREHQETWPVARLPCVNPNFLICGGRHPQMPFARGRANSSKQSTKHQCCANSHLRREASPDAVRTWACELLKAVDKAPVLRQSSCEEGGIPRCRSHVGVRTPQSSRQSTSAAPILM
jgi:hypothetical protein